MLMGLAPVVVMTMRASRPGEALMTCAGLTPWGTWAVLLPALPTEYVMALPKSSVTVWPASSRMRSRRYSCDCFVLRSCYTFTDVKRCGRCRETKEVADFQTDRSRLDGLYPWCRDCNNAYHRLRKPRKKALDREHYGAATYVRHDYFREVRIPTQAYVLGLLASDGYIVSGRFVVGLQVAAKDRCLVEFVRDQLAPGFSIRERTSTARQIGDVVIRGGDHALIEFTSTTMVADLASHGVVPKKSLVMEWPRLSEELLAPFLLGYFDGDGCVSKVTRRHPYGTYVYPSWSVLSGSRSIIDGAAAVVQAFLGIELTVRSSGRLWKIGTSGRRALAIDAWLHECGLGLARKRLAA